MRLLLYVRHWDAYGEVAGRNGIEDVQLGKQSGVRAVLFDEGIVVAATWVQW